MQGSYNLGVVILLYDSLAQWCKWKRTMQSHYDQHRRQKLSQCQTKSLTASNSFRLTPSCLRPVYKAKAHLCFGYIRPQVAPNVHYTQRLLFTLHLDCPFLLSKHLISHTHYSRLITLVTNCFLRRPALSFFHMWLLMR
jgi:hypothetical protein